MKPHPVTIHTLRCICWRLCVYIRRACYLSVRLMLIHYCDSHNGYRTEHISSKTEKPYMIESDSCREHRNVECKCTNAQSRGYANKSKNEQSQSIKYNRAQSLSTEFSWNQKYFLVSYRMLYFLEYRHPLYRIHSIERIDRING